MHDIERLNSDFGIQDELEFREGPGGLVQAEIDNPNARAAVVLQGAHLTAWAPAGEEPVIWLSKEAHFGPGKSVRGGVPVCWPWFGPHPDDPDAATQRYSTLPSRSVPRPTPYSASCPGLRRARFVSPRARLSSSRRFRDAWVGRVLRRGLGRREA